ncbi:hypothetical protein O1611_g8766 [Lasiodiplodia mahajangana]|uniref:Uncharacterized protein n=1 Tax=Lasiodiplodia mahajangana TaxID=1108764 RepID=A0ACC2JBS6_9PEZI|nr:hypothetical protein O1611_g8766 [Lasiodiplodia mahajangana]
MGNGNTESPSPPRTSWEVPSITWDELIDIVDTNQHIHLQRGPAELQRYEAWSADTRAKYGSVTTYLLTQVLPKAWGSQPFSPASTIPFQDPSDYRVLLNDWPHGFPSNVKQMVIWTRALIPTESDDGDMTPAARAVVESFVQRYFRDRLVGGTPDQLVWFRNWGATRSVPSIDHIHVLVRDVDPSIIEEWTREQEYHLAPR